MKWPKVKLTMKRKDKESFWDKYGWPQKRTTWWHAWRSLKVKSQILL